MNAPFDGEFPKAGKIYSVEAVSRMMFHHGVEDFALWFVDAPQNANGERVWGAGRFIKVTPPHEDEFDREIIEAMNGEPVTV